MKIYTLKPTGASLAKNPSNSNSDAMRILYYLRRNGGQASDEKLCDHLQIDKFQLQRAINELSKVNAVGVTATP